MKVMSETKRLEQMMQKQSATVRMGLGDNTGAVCVTTAATKWEICQQVSTDACNGKTFWQASP